VPGRAGWRARWEKEAAAPFEVAVGQVRCRERFVYVRRPMFDRAYVRGEVVVALPRQGTKTRGVHKLDLPCKNPDSASNADAAL
jgi:hypothetical protein